MPPSITLDTPVQYVRGVGPVRAEQLAELGIDTVYDLIGSVRDKDAADSVVFMEAAP